MTQGASLLESPSCKSWECLTLKPSRWNCTGVPQRRCKASKPIGEVGRRRQPPRVADRNRRRSPPCVSPARFGSHCEPIPEGPGDKLPRRRFAPQLEVGAGKADVLDGGQGVSQASHGAGRMPDRRFVSARRGTSGVPFFREGAGQQPSRSETNGVGRREATAPGGLPADGAVSRGLQGTWTSVSSDFREGNNIQDPRVNARGATAGQADGPLFRWIKPWRGAVSPGGLQANSPFPGPRPSQTRSP